MDSERIKAYMIPAEEGVGLNLLKFAGKGALSIIKSFAIVVGTLLGLTVILASSSESQRKRAAKRLANPTSEEKESLRIFEEIWRPELLRFHDACKQEFDKWAKKNTALNYGNTIQFGDRSIHYPNKNGYRGYYSYGICLIDLDYGSKAFIQEGDDYAQDTPVNAEIGQKLIEALRSLKPLINKWKQDAKKYAPYFEIAISYEDTDPDYPYVDVVLKCNHIDKDGILKPGLPPYKGK